MKNNNKAFTLLELVVVLVILSILFVVGFETMSSYTYQARNSARIQTLRSIQKSLIIYEIKSGKYPDPSDNQDITHHGGIIWHQGTIGNDLAEILRLNKIPLDPLTSDEYTYSLLENAAQFEIGTINEGGNLVSNNSIISQTNASFGEISSMIVGNYNGKMSKVFNKNNISVLAVPSIIAGNYSSTEIEKIMMDRQLSFNGYSNLPSSYSGLDVKNEKYFDFYPDNLVVFSGSTDEFNKDGNMVFLMKKLQDAYIGTLLENDPKIKEIIDINLDTPSLEIKKLARKIVKDNLSDKEVVIED